MSRGFIIHVGISNFLGINQECLCITDTKHNVNSSRYQAIIGGNYLITFGNWLLDTLMLKLLGVKQDIYSQGICDLFNWLAT